MELHDVASFGVNVALPPIGSPLTKRMIILDIVLSIADLLSTKLSFSSLKTNWPGGGTSS